MKSFISSSPSWHQIWTVHFANLDLSHPSSLTDECCVLDPDMHRKVLCPGPTPSRPLPACHVAVESSYVRYLCCDCYCPTYKRLIANGRLRCENIFGDLKYLSFMFGTQEQCNVQSYRARCHNAYPNCGCLLTLLLLVEPARNWEVQ